MRTFFVTQTIFLRILSFVALVHEEVLHILREVRVDSRDLVVVAVVVRTEVDYRSTVALVLDTMDTHCLGMILVAVPVGTHMVGTAALLLQAFL